MKRITTYLLFVLVGCFTTLTACGGEPGDELSIPYDVLAEGLSVGEPFAVDVITSAAELASLDVAAEEPDFSSSVVFVFTLAESSSPNCQLQPMSELRFHVPEGRLYPTVPMLGEVENIGEFGCEGDANPHRVIISVDRDDLPETSFSAWIGPDRPPSCCEDNVVHFAAGELTTPGAEFPALAADGAIPIGETRIAYDVSTHCGINPFARTIDGSSWLAADPSVMSGIDPMPDGWTSSDSQRIDLVIERTGDDDLTITAVDTDVSIDYVRSSETFGCD